MCLKELEGQTESLIQEQVHDKLNERQTRHSHLVQVYRGGTETRKSHTDSTHAIKQTAIVNKESE